MDRRGYQNEPLRNPEMAERIKGLLEARGWSQGDLMRHAGISRSEASRLNGGVRSPGCKVLAAIAKAFGVSTDYLISGGDQNTAENLAPDIIEFLKKYWDKLDHSDKTLLRVTIGHLAQKVNGQTK